MVRPEGFLRMIQYIYICCTAGKCGPNPTFFCLYLTHFWFYLFMYFLNLSLTLNQNSHKLKPPISHNFNCPSVHAFLFYHLFLCQVVGATCQQVRLRYTQSLAHIQHPFTLTYMPIVSVQLVQCEETHKIKDNSMRKHDVSSIVNYKKKTCTNLVSIQTCRFYVSFKLMFGPTVVA